MVRLISGGLLVLCCLSLVAGELPPEESEGAKKAAERDAADVKAGKGPVGYGLMLDAGSTGSRVHVYRWVWGAGALPEVTDDFFFEVKPGVSSYKDEPSKGGASLEPLLQYAYDHMPRDRIKDTWVRLYATAGLRLLPVEQQDALLESIRDTLQASPFIFERSWVAISAGVEEAVDAWISANYILEVATDPDPKNTIGTLDLGGGSIQITCRPSSGEIPEDLKHDLSLAGHSVPLYAKSHLAYGLMQARKRADQLVKKSGKKEHPCFLKGTSTEIDGEEYQGTSDYEGCKELQNNLHQFCAGQVDDCFPMNNVPAPKTEGNFLAFSYFYDVLTEFLPGVDKPTVAQVTAKTQEVCGSEFEPLAAAHTGYEPKNKEFMRRACHDLSYITYLLGTHLGFAPEDQRIELVKKLKGKEMSWTLGASLKMIKNPKDPKAEL
eukprot:CAMPEP_0184293066 /NCGR_PEP_ID=MMETSP1049-20130417/4634_1 /TAXON_ID=77928 /ORGANISM="Proteomonas sulcata, Strain CCMP704" /LENGTH=435 /DNA_ID=CAMNT_0026600995 /DNA_START=42 /DNA_END=1349 /DNA_ORIENTATION=-